MNWKKPRGTREDDLDDEYFDKDDDDYQNKPAAEEDDEIDPLDAYMNNLDENVKKVEHLVHDNKKNLEIMKSDDPLDSFLDGMKEKMIKEHNKKHNIKKKEGNNPDDEDDEYPGDEEDEHQYDFLDSEGNLDFDAIRNKKKQKIEPLPVIGHSKVEYEPFNKNFYDEHEEIRDLPDDRVRSLRHEFEIRVHGLDVPKPIVSFAHLQFDDRMTNLILKKEFEKPTAIQCQALPCGLSGRDIIGIAKTGSGKTLAYVWPLIIHILDQREVDKNEGPIGLIMCPTRELAQQVYIETKRFAKIYNIQVAAILGGENKHEQWKELKAGVDIIIATPGRLIEMVKKKATNLKRCTYVVLDEADRMFSMGFEYQVRSIIGQIRPDRQILLFSATFNNKVQKLCMDILQDPIRINVGKDNQANEDVRQEVLVLYNPDDKLNWLLGNLPHFVQTGKTLIFANQILACEELSKQITESLSFPTLTLHGDKLQQERTVIVNNFKTKPEQNILVATDVASRGLDIPDIRTVINFEIPKDGDTYIHRIGRTGRAGNKEGTAYTLLMNYEVQFAITLTKILEVSGQPVPKDLENLCFNDEEYARNKKMKKMGFKKNNISALLEKAIKRGQKDKTGLGYNSEKSEEKPKTQSYAPKSGYLSGFVAQQPSAQPQTYGALQQQQQQQSSYTTAYQNPVYQAPQVSSYVPQQSNVYQTTQGAYYGAAPTGFVSQQQYQQPVPNVRDSREQIRAEYSNRMKGNMETQFKNSFVSSGSIEPTKSVPTITFRNSKPNQEHDLVPKPSNITIKLPKKKPEQFVPPVMQQQQQQPEAVIPPQYDAPLVRGRFGNSAEDSIRSTTDLPPRKSRFSDVPDSSLEPEVGKRLKND